MAAAMQGYDLVCTYNWGAMDAVLAHTLFADVYKLPPMVHHEDGFNEDEAEQRKPSRNLYRRFALGRVSALVVPSHTLERIALEEWEQPRTRVRRIPNGIATRAFARQAQAPTCCPASSSAKASCGSARWPGCGRSRTSPRWSVP